MRVKKHITLILPLLLIAAITVALAAPGSAAAKKKPQKKETLAEPEPRLSTPDPVFPLQVIKDTLPASPPASEKAQPRHWQDNLARPAIEDQSLSGLPRFDYADTARRNYIVNKITIHGAAALDPVLIKDRMLLQEGDTLEMPGDRISAVVRELLDRRLFSDVKVAATPVGNDGLDLDFYLQERTIVTDWKFSGLRSNDIKELKENKLKLRRMSELSEYSLQTKMKLMREYFDEKGFRAAKLNYRIEPDSIVPGAVTVTFVVNRGRKVRIGDIEITGEKNLPEKKLKASMKKTHEPGINIFRSTKYNEKLYREDLGLITAYARSKGYRDAAILSDTVYTAPNKKGKNKIHIKIAMEEGNLYHYRHITWIGNTVYPTMLLEEELGLGDGDVYDSESMADRLGIKNNPFERSIANSLYRDNGYLAFSVEPIETVFPGDSVDVEIRISEGSQFRTRNVTFQGNTRTNDHVIRRELAVAPGDLYNQSLMLMSYQRLASMGQFDPNTITPNINPIFQSEQVDIDYSFTEVRNDQVEISGGWGAGMFVGSVGVNFTNVSMRRLFDGKKWHNFYPQGDAQQLGIKIQTNGTYYRALSVNFMEPWLGGRKPTALSISFYTSRETNAYYWNSTSSAHFGTIGGVIGISKRINWPDPYFSYSVGVTMQTYNLKDWTSFVVQNGTCNTLAVNLGIQRNSVDDLRLFPRRGSLVSLNVALTPPWSLFDGKDYSSSTLSNNERYHWIEYHKWGLNAMWFTPLTPNNKLVLMARAQFGYLGYYDRYKRSPFEGYQMGGDGLSGYSLYGVETVGLRGYKNGSLTPLASYGMYASIYSKYTAEVRYLIANSAATMVYALVFAEAGNAFSELQQFQPFDLKRSLGFGLRVNVPFLGMLGVDWGYGFDRVAETQGKRSGGRVHFTMGTTF